MRDIVLGDVTVTRVMEYTGPVGMRPDEFFPESPDRSWREHAD